MALYTVHVPENAPDHVSRADRTVFVREGFTFWGLVFGWLFLLWHRLWLALLAWLVLASAIAACAWALRLPPESILALIGLMHLFVGIEGNDLRRWGLERKRFRLADVVSGTERDQAEYAFFSRPPEDPLPQAPPRPSRMVARDSTPSVIGMFPDQSSP